MRIDLLEQLFTDLTRVKKYKIQYEEKNLRVHSFERLAVIRIAVVLAPSVNVIPEERSYLKRHIMKEYNTLRVETNFHLIAN